MSQLAPPLKIRAGVVTATKEPVAVEFSDDHFAEHMAIYGGTGKGKSKFVELMLRQIIDQGRGACVIDPHGDLVEVWEVGRGHQMDSDGPKLVKLTVWTKLN